MIFYVSGILFYPAGICFLPTGLCWGFCFRRWDFILLAGFWYTTNTTDDRNLTNKKETPILSRARVMVQLKFKAVLQQSVHWARVQSE
jgi:hypothetical protein